MRKENINRLVILVMLTVTVSALHYFTTTEREALHDIYRRLYYIPIVLGGLWFSLRGGITVAILASVLYLPHIFLHWDHNPGIRLEQYLEILLYNLIGFMTGFLSDRERRQKERAQDTARQLEESYEKLRVQADQILDIEEQLRRADRLTALGELSAGMAHEIGNPLGSIRGTAEILQEGFSPDDKRYEFAQILVQEVERLNGVVQDFLAFARPEPPGEDHFRPQEVIAEVVQLMQQPSRKHNVEIKLDLAESPQLCGHREQLKQVFINLVLNAMQAMPTGGHLMITSRVADNTIEFRFADTGSGISEDVQKSIFNPFFTTKSEGTGLGLAITQRIVTAHGGEITIEQSSPEGTVFRVALPHSKDCREHKERQDD